MSILTKLVHFHTTTRTLRNKSEFKWLNGVMIRVNSVFKLQSLLFNYHHNLNSVHSSTNCLTKSLYLTESTESLRTTKSLRTTESLRATESLRTTESLRSTESLHATKPIDFVNCSKFKVNSYFSSKIGLKTNTRLSNAVGSYFNANVSHSFLNSKQISHTEFRRFLNHQLIHKLDRPNKSTRRKSKSTTRKSTRSTKMEDLNETTFTYNEAIETLNTLQSNKIEILANQIASRELLSAKVKRTKELLGILGIDQDDLSSMNIVHVSGTKGKGSTCAFTESILRKKGFKTGLFTSPHLITVRERIQINGKPIERDLFAKNLFECYSILKSYIDSTATSNQSSSSLPLKMPFYFNFLTLMSLYTFKQQGCNAVIMEVGIGGEFDCTNIIDKPVVVGVSSLGIDHVKLLGNTLKEIAWHKSGIFKRDVPAFISNDQKIEALDVLLERAEEKQCPIRISPPLDDYKLEENRRLKLGIAGCVQKLNASLALQISDYFVNKIKNKLITNDLDLKVKTGGPLYANHFKLTNDYLDAIEECKWRGRYETIELKNKSRFYCDGAHTVESLNYCIDWFKEECEKDELINRDKLFKILIFNCTGYRDFYQLLKPLLAKEKFDLICFTTNLKNVQDLNDTKSDLFHAGSDHTNRDEHKEKILESLDYTGTVKHFDCLENCLKGIKIKNDENLLNNLKTKVLVTGSIYLVGGVISLLNERYC